VSVDSNTGELVFDTSQMSAGDTTFDLTWELTLVDGSTKTITETVDLTVAAYTPPTS